MRSLQWYKRGAAYETIDTRYVPFDIDVTPCMGVWIETDYPIRPPQPPYVTPCMGVWIETFDTNDFFCCSLSHTLYGCVDWNQESAGGQKSQQRHTLYGCVDWNLITFCKSSRIRCHTLYGCVDWNFCFVYYCSSPCVTPCMGVWIETSWVDKSIEPDGVTPCMGVWIETQNLLQAETMSRVTPCMGVWIETSKNGKNAAFSFRHTLYGCVDWNTLIFVKHLQRYVTPCMGVWIETDYLCTFAARKIVTPCMGVWIETLLTLECFNAGNVTPCMGVWIETRTLI